MRSFTRTLVVAAGTVHLALMIFGATPTELPFGGRIGDVVRALGVVTGTGFGYSFFAPEVNANILVRFEVQTHDGRTERDSLDRGANREASIRISNLAEAFDGEDVKLRQSLAASWAGTIFARHPRAQSVTVIVESCDVPPMAEFRKGERPFWANLYRAKFEWPKGKTR